MNIEHFVLSHRAAKDDISRLIRTDKFPRTLLIAGPASVGKSTLARYIALTLTKGEEYINFKEDFDSLTQGKNLENVKQFNLSNIKDITLTSLMSEWTTPMSGDLKVLILDEAHNIKTNVQESILDKLEHGIKNVKVILCTTSVEMLTDSFLSRTYRLNLYALSDADKATIVRRYIEERNLSFQGVNKNLFIALLMQSFNTVRSIKNKLGSYPINHTIVPSDLSLINTSTNISQLNIIIQGFYTNPCAGITILKSMVVDGILKKYLIDITVVILGGRDYDIVNKAEADELYEFFKRKDSKPFLVFIAEALRCRSTTEIIGAYLGCSLKATSQTVVDRKVLPTTSVDNNLTYNSKVAVSNLDNYFEEV